MIKKEKEKNSLSGQSKSSALPSSSFSTSEVAQIAENSIPLYASISLDSINDRLSRETRSPCEFVFPSKIQRPKE